MSIKLKPVAWLMASALLFASCLGSDNNEEYDFYDDAAISSFSLGTMSKTVFTLDSKGEDSMYVEEYKGSEYKFSIDHVNGKIYNLDSLPYRTDVKKVIANITSKNRLPLRTLPMTRCASIPLLTLSTSLNHV